MLVETSPSTGDGRCWDRCNACRHVHHGRDGGYTCPRCSCVDRFVAPEVAG